jgi:hypothetical protein
VDRGSSAIYDFGPTATNAERGRPDISWQMLQASVLQLLSEDKEVLAAKPHDASYMMDISNDVQLCRACDKL